MLFTFALCLRGLKQREEEEEKKKKKKTYKFAEMWAVWVRNTYILFGEQAFEMRECIFSHRLLFGSKITYAEISAEIKRFLNLK